MQIISAADIRSWNRLYRANFINSLSGVKPVSLIGTVNQQGQTNLSIFSNIVHLGSDPALVGFINRPREAAPHTLANIEATGSYTINHIHPGIVEEAHQTSAKYPEGVSEFEATGLTPRFIDSFPAPFVEESRLKYALTLQELIPIAINQTFLVIGKVEFVLLDDTILDADGFLHTEQIDSVCSGGIDAYYTTQWIGRFQYAKPGEKTERIGV